MKKLIPLAAAAAVLFGCAENTVVKPGYDFGGMRRIGVWRFDDSVRAPSGVEDLFSKHMLGAGFDVVDRLQLEGLLRQRKIDPSAPLTRQAMEALGLDGLLVGALTAYSPEREQVMNIPTQERFEEPVFQKVREKRADGSYAEVDQRIGTKVRFTSKNVPHRYSTDAQVSLTAKLLDARTGEIVWAGSYSDEGTNGPTAMDSTAYYLVKKLRKQCAGALAKARPAVPAPEPVDDVDVPPRTGVPPNPNAYAVVIGVEKYRQPDIPAADFAARDAQSVYNYLTRAMGYPVSNVILLKNDQANKADFEKYLGAWLKNRVSAASKVFVYFSGHGAPNPATGESYLVPYDGDPSYTEETAYSLTRLYATLAQLPSQDVTAVLDSCFSGRGKRSIISPGARPLVAVRTPEISSAGSAVILAASGAGQISASYAPAQHGLMTFYLLQGLKGKADLDHDGDVTTRELFQYMKPEIEAEARKQNVEQSPVLSPALEDLQAKASKVWLWTAP